MTTYVTSDEALRLLRRIVSGQAVPEMKDPSHPWNEPTVELLADGWKMVVFTDQSRSRHLESLTSPDGRHGDFENWRSDVEFSQQPEDRLNREDGKAVDRMFQACRASGIN